MKKTLSVIISVSLLLSMVFTNMFIYSRFALAEEISNGDNLILNSGFENDLNYWDSYDVTKTIVTDEFNSGAKALHYVTANPWSNIGQTVTLRKGQQYYFSMYIKGNGGASGGDVIIAKAPDYPSVFSSYNSVAGTWIKVETLFTWTGDDASLPLAIRPCTSGVGDVYIDDVIFKPVTNQLENSSFENDFTSWSSYEVNYSISTTESYSGSKSLHYIANVAWSNVGQNVDLKKGQKYHYSMYIKAGGATANGDVILARAPDYPSIIAAYSATSDGWTKVEGYFTWTEASITVPIAIRPCTTGGTDVYIDDIVFEPVTNLLANPGFENDFTDWSSYEVNYSTSTTVTNSGAKSLHYVANVSWSNIGQNVDLKKGQKYHFSMFIKAGDATANGDVILARAPDYPSIIASYSATSEGWTKVEGDFTWSEADLTVPIAIRPCSSSGTDVYLDDIVFEAIGDPIAEEPATDGNLLKNSDFESETLVWETLGTASGSGIAANEAFAGTQSYKIIREQSYAYIGQSVDLVKGQQYCFTAYIKAEGADAVGGRFQFGENTGYAIGSTFDIAVSDGWKKIESLYTWTGENVTTIFYLQPFTISGSVVYADKIAFKPIYLGNNHIKNPGMEDEPVEWGCYPVGEGYGIDSSDAFSGLKSFKMVSGSEYANISQSINLVKDSEYYFSAYIKTVGGDLGSARFLFGENTGYTSGLSFSVAQADGWKKIDGFYTWTGADISTTFILQPMVGSSVTAVYIDDVVFTPVYSEVQKTVGENMLINPSFENEPIEWVLDSCGEESGIQTSDVFSGLKSFKMTAQNEYANISQTINLIKDSEYYFSAYIKTIGDDLSGARFLFGANTGYALGVTFSVAEADGWKKVEGFYTWTGANITTKFHLQPMLGSFATAVYIDDVVFAPYGSSNGGEDPGDEDPNTGDIYDPILVTDKVMLLADFEDGLHGYKDTSSTLGIWGSSSQVITIDRATGSESLVGDGSLRVVTTTIESGKLASFGTDSKFAAASGYDGLVLRVRSTDVLPGAMLRVTIATKNGQSALGDHGVYLSKTGVMRALDINAVNAGITLKADVDGYYLMPFADGNIKAAGDWNYALPADADFSETTVNFIYYDATGSWTDSQLLVDSIGLYKGEDISAITGDLGDIVELGNNASINDILLDGIPMAGLDPEIAEYTLPMPDSFTPEIEVKTVDPNAYVSIEFDTKLIPCTATINVTSGIASKAYKLNFVQESSDIASVETLADINVPVGTDFGSVKLPAYMTVLLENGMSTRVYVKWSSALSKFIEAGQYIVKGAIDIDEPVGNPLGVVPQIRIIVKAPLHELYVSPDAAINGTGTLESPFSSIAAAKSAVKALAAAMTGDIIVYLKGGEYPIADTLVFTDEDSGKNGYRIVYKAFENEIPRFTGGKKINGWTLFDSAKGIYRASAGEGFDTRQLYVNGQRAQRARGGNAGGSIAFTANYAGFILPATGEYADMESWNNISDVQFIVQQTWQHSFLNVLSVDGRDVTMKKNYNNGYFDRSTVLYVENAYELLDTAGEWYLNKTDGYIYYMPKSGEDMTTASVIAGDTEVLLAVQGTLDKPAGNLIFDGIVFENNTWLRPNSLDAYISHQAGNTTSYRMNAAVQMNAAKNVSISNCLFTHLGNTGLSIENGSQDNIVFNNKFTDISGHGISLGGITLDDHHPADKQKIVLGNSIVFNEISDVAREYKDCQGIFGGYIRETIITNNDISNIPYTAIQVGWGWGEPDDAFQSIAGYNRIAFNKVHDFLKEMTDGGGIYVQGEQKGTVIAYNHIYDQANNQYASIYLDNGSEFIGVYGNVVEKTAGSNMTWWYFSTDDWETQMGESYRFLNSNYCYSIHNFFSEGLTVMKNGRNNILEDNIEVFDGNWPAMATAVMKNAGRVFASDLTPLTDEITGISIIGFDAGNIPEGAYLRVIEGAENGDILAKIREALGADANIIGLYSLALTDSTGINSMAHTGVLVPKFPIDEKYNPDKLYLCYIGDDGSVKILTTSYEEGQLSGFSRKLGLFALVTLEDIAIDDDDDDNGGSPDTSDSWYGLMLANLALLTLIAIASTKRKVNN
ncbi:MAG: carbohydrate binding domain-containing protein [Saccharofermentanales bacterium]